MFNNVPTHSCIEEVRHFLVSGVGYALILKVGHVEVRQTEVDKAVQRSVRTDGVLVGVSRHKV